MRKPTAAEQNSGLQLKRSLPFRRVFIIITPQDECEYTARPTKHYVNRRMREGCAAWEVG